MTAGLERGVQSRVRARGAHEHIQQGTSSLRALVYHRLQPRDDLAPDLVSATPRVFEQHLRHLARWYVPIAADEVLAAITSGHRLPTGAVLVTFDDGYRDFLEVAWPLLRQHHIPVVLFVCTAFADDPAQTFWWDVLWQLLSRTTRTTLDLGPRQSWPLRSFDERSKTFVAAAEWLKRMTPAWRRAAMRDLSERLVVTPQAASRASVLSWPELRQLAADGVTVASHGQTHELLNQLDSAALVREVCGSRDQLTSELGSAVPLLAYPNGNFDARVIRVLADAQYRGAFTTMHGLSKLPAAEPLALRRDPAGVSVRRLGINLFGPIAVTRALRHPLPRPRDSAIR